MIGLRELVVFALILFVGWLSVFLWIVKKKKEKHL